MFDSLMVSSDFCGEIGSGDVIVGSRSEFEELELVTLIKFLLRQERMRQFLYNLSEQRSKLWRSDLFREEYNEHRTTEFNYNDARLKTLEDVLHFHYCAILALKICDTLSLRISKLCYRPFLIYMNVYANPKPDPKLFFSTVEDEIITSDEEDGWCPSPPCTAELNL